MNYRYLEPRKLEKRRDELQNEIDDLTNRAEELEDELRDSPTHADRERIEESLRDIRSDIEDWTTGDEGAELNALTELLATCDRNELLIDDTDFEEYARELAEEIGAIDRNASWPNTCIDWKRAAKELQVDYSEFEYEGTTYWQRSV